MNIINVIENGLNAPFSDFSCWFISLAGMGYKIDLHIGYNILDFREVVPNFLGGCHIS